MWRKYIKTLFLGIVSLLISGLTFFGVGYADQKTDTGYGVVKDFRQFEVVGSTLNLELEGNNLSTDGHVTNQTTSLKLSNNTALDNEFLLLGNSTVAGNWNFAGGTQQTLSLEVSLEPDAIYQIIQNIDGKKTAVGYFTVKKGELINLPPTLHATSRTVEKGDSSFNIMDGVSAYDGNGNDITSRVTYDGQVDISTAGIYPIVYKVTDLNGLSASKSINVTVQEGSSFLEPPSLNTVTASDTSITGTAKYLAGAKVYVILGAEQATFRADIEEDGTFTISLEHTYPIGTSITAYVQDAQGKKSAEVYGVVKQGQIMVGVNRILSSDTVITGYTSPGAVVEVDVDNKKTRDHIYTGTADSTGEYSIDMKGQSYPAGTTVIVTATLNGVSDSQTVTIYPKKVSIGSLSVGSNIISGTADSNATVYFTVNSKEYQFKADAAGSFYGTVDNVLQIGDQIIAYQISNDIRSDSTTETLN
ncbi:Ig-like domain-containing protein [Lactococcus lactis]|uniref:Ig-like domain-containing protein n=1 Tax=Lactococcus lactis TaxID=1358 RepID=UPI002659D385|nr:Ig-like domain-containing protein [Lactococcus lactis]WKF72353.1 Ig-like domain-containing protein [Lactococcus lactis]